ncbi:MAG: hypothetical protein OXJ90_05115 [Spirochaetaceae bacterium]|nr:hypothetical protein [Spirochaetaceae bacterium]
MQAQQFEQIELEVRDAVLDAAAALETRVPSTVSRIELTNSETASGPLAPRTNPIIAG